MIELLDLEEFKDKPVGECSPGVSRRLAIALSFFGPANIVLLDEPTASLDPVARHSAHELMSFYKGRKTILLCTHLLSEAEMLCDIICIMIKGCIYTVAPPAALTSKFGKAYRIDMLLSDEGDAGQKCDEFMNVAFRDPFCIVSNSEARLYEVSSENLKISQVMKVLEAGMKDGRNGVRYYTCSSASLETVFLEIYRRCESEQDVTRHLVNYLNGP